MPVLPLDNPDYGCNKNKAAVRFLKLLLDSPVCPTLKDYRDVFTAALLCASEGCFECRELYRELRQIRLLNFECTAAYTLRVLLNSIIDGRMNVVPIRAKSLIDYSESHAVSSCPECSSLIKTLYNVTKGMKEEAPLDIKLLIDSLPRIPISDEDKPIGSEIKLKPKDNVL